MRNNAAHGCDATRYAAGGRFDAMAGVKTRAHLRAGLLRPDLLGRPRGPFWREHAFQCGHCCKHLDDATSRARKRQFHPTNRPLVAAVHRHGWDAHWVAMKETNAAQTRCETDRPGLQGREAVSKADREDVQQLVCRVG